MEKNYRYAIRKTTLGVASIAIAAFLAGQTQPSVVHADTTAAETVLTTKPDGDVPQPVPDESETPKAVNYAGEGPEVNTDRATTTPNEENKKPAAEDPAKAGTGKYHDDEAKIQNASDKERYRTSELPQGEGVVKTLGADDFGTAVEGFQGDQVNPIATSTGEKRKEFAVEIKIDKKMVKEPIRISKLPIQKIV